MHTKGVRQIKNWLIYDMTTFGLVSSQNYSTIPTSHIPKFKGARWNSETSTAEYNMYK